MGPPLTVLLDDSSWNPLSFHLKSLPFYYLGGKGMRTENQASVMISDWETGLERGIAMPKHITRGGPEPRTLSIVSLTSHLPIQGNLGASALQQEGL